MKQLRIYNKLIQTYVRGIVNDIHSDGLAHPDFRIARTSTGRLVITHPPVQVLPHHAYPGTDFASQIRRLFPARPGYVMVSADYAQLELRIMCALSGDQELWRTLNERDFHTHTSSIMFRKPAEQVTKADRHDAKRVVFGVAYGRSAFTLARGPLLDITGGDRDQAQAFIDRFFGAYPDYHRYWQWCRNEAVSKGELTNPFGRKRRWMLITRENKVAIENEGCNFPVQSSASDMCSLGFVEVERDLTKYKLGHALYTVHDAVLSEVREDRLREGIACITEAMMRPRFDTRGVTCPVEVEVGPTLGDVRIRSGEEDD